MTPLMIAALAALATPPPATPQPALPAPAAAPAGEKPVAPYAQSDANAGAKPIPGDRVYLALHGRAGIQRIVDNLIDRNLKDARIADIFRAADLVRLRRTLTEQICYISGGPCHYSGRDMKASHADMGLQTRDFDALVENLQLAMNDEGVAIHAQNRLLAKLAPMRRTTVER